MKMSGGDHRAGNENPSAPMWSSKEMPENWKATWGKGKQVSSRRPIGLSIAAPELPTIKSLVHTPICLKTWAI